MVALCFVNNSICSLSNKNSNCKDTSFLTEKGHRIWSGRRRRGKARMRVCGLCGRSRGVPRPLPTRAELEAQGPVPVPPPPGRPADVSPGGQAFGRKAATLWCRAHPAVAAPCHRFRLWRNDFFLPLPKPIGPENLAFKFGGIRIRRTQGGARRAAHAQNGLPAPRGLGSRVGPGWAPAAPW